jgi:hypothetical protein
VFAPRALSHGQRSRALKRNVPEPRVCELDRALGFGDCLDCPGTAPPGVAQGVWLRLLYAHTRTRQAVCVCVDTSSVSPRPAPHT